MHHQAIIIGSNLSLFIGGGKGGGGGGGMAPHFFRFLYCTPPTSYRTNGSPPPPPHTLNFLPPPMLFIVTEPYTPTLNFLNKMAEKSLKDKLLCLDTYTDPKLLQCLHVFCQTCLVRLCFGMSKDNLFSPAQTVVKSHLFQSTPQAKV